MASTKAKTSTACEGHGENSTAPSVRKGSFHAVGTYLDAGAMTSTSPKGIGPNVKTGKNAGGAE